MNATDITKLVNINVKPIRHETVVWVTPEKRNQWCQMQYSGYPKGCPNYGNRSTCPPHTTSFREVVDSFKYLYLIYAKFNLGKFKAIRHEDRERKNLPPWSDRQLGNPRHWQNQLKRMMRDFILGITYKDNKHPVIYKNKKVLFTGAYLLGAGSGFWNVPSMEAGCIYVFGTLKHNKIACEIKPKKVITMVTLLMTYHPVLKRKQNRLPRIYKTLA